MEKDKIKMIVASVIYNHQGGKSTELVVKIVEEIFSVGEIVPDSQSLLGIINEMIDDGEIVAVDYVLPNFLYKVKTFWLPKGTKLLQMQKEE